MKTKKGRKEKKVRLCKKCGVNPAQKRHTCPYETEIYSDYDKKCNCCVECEKNCMWEV